MLSRSLIRCLILTSTLVGAGSACAAWDALPVAPGAGRQERPGLDFAAGEQLAALTPEERQRLREQIRDQWQNRPPEERDRLKDEFRRRRQEPPPDPRREQREPLRDRLQQMPPEDRRAFREELRQRRNEGGWQGQERPERPGGGDPGRAERREFRPAGPGNFRR